ncbi:hypothetical protein [Spiroplasma endosymbiont of Amphibalanus improvisus]|uniref:hypothetical protein n=1 Tax=Spiroplasma endosymbiont of Amphibalanus improvisus TaxID=3066327 RepID=UPI00313BF38F
MKKLLSVLSTCAIVGPSICSVVACNIIKPVVPNSVWTITDGGTINDASFNQQAWEAAEEYADVNSSSANYIETLAAGGGTTPSTSDFTQSYQIAKMEGANYVIMPGFKHGNSLQQANDVFGMNGGGTYGLYLDGTIDTSKQQNLVGVQYAGEISGIEAGIVTSLFLYDYHKTEHEYHPTIATYGGMSNPSSVNSYMWGFVEGARLINFAIKESTTNNDAQALLEQFNSILESMCSDPYVLDNSSPLVYMNSAQVHCDGKDGGNYNKNNSYGLSPYGDDKQWFSGTFDPTDQSATAIINKAFSTGTDAIMPVAGPQSNIVLKQIDFYEPKMKKDLFLVGVDTSAKDAYPDQDQKIITSALKNLKQSSNDVMTGLADGSLDPGQNFTYTEQPDPSSGIDYLSWMGVSESAEIKGVQVTPKTVSLVEGIKGPQSKELYDYINALTTWYEDPARNWSALAQFSDAFKINPDLTSPNSVNQ